MGPGPMGAVEKAEDFKGTLKKLFRYLEHALNVEQMHMEYLVRKVKIII